MIKKIAFVGNCQVYGLGYYFKKAFPDIEVKIILIHDARTYLIEDDVQRKLLNIQENMIDDDNEAIDYLNQCDVVCSHNITDFSCNIYRSSTMKRNLKSTCSFYIICPFRSPDINKFVSFNSRIAFCSDCISLMRKVNLNNQNENIECDGFIEPTKLIYLPDEEILEKSDNELIKSNEANYLKPICYLNYIKSLCVFLEIPFELDVEAEKKKIFPYTNYHDSLNEGGFCGQEPTDKISLLKLIKKTLDL